jgi:hypothetical protein
MLAHHSLASEECGSYKVQLQAFKAKQASFLCVLCPTLLLLLLLLLTSSLSCSAQACSSS